MCKGVWPAVVAESGSALCSRSSLTSSLWPMRAAQCRGVWSSWTQNEEEKRGFDIATKQVTHHQPAANFTVYLRYLTFLFDSLFLVVMIELGLHCSYLSPGIHLRGILQKELSNFTVSCSGGHVEGSLHFLVQVNTYNHSRQFTYLHVNCVYIIFNSFIHYCIFVEHLEVQFVQILLFFYVCLLSEFQDQGQIFFFC